MGVERISRWVWILIGAGIGLGVDAVRRMPKGSWSAEYGQSMSQLEFESGLKPRSSGTRQFTNLVIYPEQVSDHAGNTRDVQIVSGDYSGRYEVRNGKYGPVVDRRAFVAEVPYRTLADLGANTPGKGDVRAYVDGLKKNDATLSYTYIWWREARYSRSFWVGCGVVAIGLVWPTVINLLTYGKFFRPREPKGIDLSGVSAAPASSAAPAVSHADLDRAAALAAEIEKKLAAEAGDGAPVLVTADVPAPIKKLGDAPLPEVATQAGAQAEFSRKPDDFYPTERHPHPTPREQKE